MNRLIALSLAALCALPLLAQVAETPAVPDAEGKKVVATVNGTNITKAELDLLWKRMGEKMRAQYEKTGNGKIRFLENYVGKRLLLQLAQESGFGSSPEIQAELEAAKEAALFDLYVRDVVASQIVTEADVRKFYDGHPTEFRVPERAKVRMIQVSTANRTREQARAIISGVMRELFAAKAAANIAPQMLIDAFADQARDHSEHGSASAGGDLGWITRDSLEGALAAAAFSLQRGVVSGILESDSGLHLLLVEERQAASIMPYEDARAGIREFLVSQSSQKVVEALSRATNELRASSKVALFPENVQ
jgi:parvulin-like peptidyl-prolyl isomerase